MRMVSTYLTGNLGGEGGGGGSLVTTRRSETMRGSTVKLRRNIKLLDLISEKYLIYSELD